MRGSGKGGFAFSVYFTDFRVFFKVVLSTSFVNTYRKLMNRIAAQNARDRKKNYVEDLEKRVAELEAKVR